MKNRHSVMHIRHYVLPLVCAIAAIGLLGCNKNETEKPASQVAAKVNGTEITVHQLNFYVSKAGNLSTEKSEQVRKVVLDQLIEQELFAAKAIEGKLDTKPETVMAIEMAKKEILARSYLEQQLAAGEKLQRGADVRYYYAHPELFAERKIYNLQELSFGVGTAKPEEIQELIKEKKSLEQIAERLTKQGIQFTKAGGIRAAEQLPLDILPQLHAAKTGDLLFITDAKDHNVILIVGTRSEPVEESKATPIIQRFLSSKLVNDLKNKELKALKSTAKIEYIEQFAAYAPSAGTPPTPTQPAAQVTPLSPDSKPGDAWVSDLTKLPTLPQENKYPDRPRN